MDAIEIIKIIAIMGCAGIFSGLVVFAVFYELMFRMNNDFQHIKEARKYIENEKVGNKCITRMLHS